MIRFGGKRVILTLVSGKANLTFYLDIGNFDIFIWTNVVVVLFVLLFLFCFCLGFFWTRHIYLDKSQTDTCIQMRMI